MIHLHGFLKNGVGHSSREILHWKSVRQVVRPVATSDPSWRIFGPPVGFCTGKLNQNRLKQDHDDQHRKQRAMNFGTALVPFLDVSAEHFFRCVGEAISWPTPQVTSVPLQPVVWSFLFR